MGEEKDTQKERNNQTTGIAQIPKGASEKRTSKESLRRSDAKKNADRRGKGGAGSWRKTPSRREKRPEGKPGGKRALVPSPEGFSQSPQKNMGRTPQRRKDDTRGRRKTAESALSRNK